jgi:hypothetical protein
VGPSKGIKTGMPGLSTTKSNLMGSSPFSIVIDEWGRSSRLFDACIKTIERTIGNCFRSEWGAHEN